MWNRPHASAWPGPWKRPWRRCSAATPCWKLPLAMGTCRHWSGHHGHTAALGAQVLNHLPLALGSGVGNHSLGAEADTVGQVLNSSAAISTEQA